jgi:hypothetical protein
VVEGFRHPNMAMLFFTYDFILSTSVNLSFLKTNTASLCIPMWFYIKGCQYYSNRLNRGLNETGIFERVSGAAPGTGSTAGIRRATAEATRTPGTHPEGSFF